MTGDSLETATMAELYLAQGHRARAVAIYRRLVRDNPADPKLAQRLAELDGPLPPADQKGSSMSFREHLDTIVNGTPGAVYAAIMGFDGIPIDTIDKGSPTIDLSTLITEYSATAHQLKRTADDLPSAGRFDSLVITTAEVCCLIRPLTHEYFMTLIITAGSLTGKANYLMRVAAPKVVRELQI